MDTNILLLIALLVIGFLAFRFLTKSRGDASSDVNNNDGAKTTHNPNLEKKKQMDELFRMPQSMKSQSENNAQNERLQKLKVSPPENSVNGVTAKIKEIDPKFSLKQFIKGAEVAFEEIIKAFSLGNKELLKKRLNDTAFQVFSDEIDRRNNQNEHLEIQVRSFKIVDVIRAKFKDDIARLKVKFVTHQVSLQRNTEGDIINGEEDVPKEHRDIWVFERKISSTNPNWTLIHTGSE